MVRRGQRIDAIAARERQISRLMAEQRLDVAALSREDRGGMAKRFVRDELALAWSRSPRQAENRLLQAQVFADFPAVVARVADGSWHLDHADAVLDELVGSGLSRPEQEQVLDLVLSRPGNRTPWELREQVRTALVVLFPEAAAERARRARTDRDVQTCPAGPGAALLSAYGPAADVAAMSASLDALCWPPAPGDTRTAAQRRFDTLRDLVCGRLQPGSWQLQVLVGLATLEGRDELPGEIPGLGPLPAVEVRRLLAHGATLRRVVVDDHGRLVGVDDTVHRPDLAPAGPRPDRVPAHPAEELAEDHELWLPEPDPDAPSTEDLAWLDAQHDQASRDRDRGTNQVRDRQLHATRAHTRHHPGPAPDPADAPAPADDTPAEPSYPAGGWSVPALLRALHRLRTDPFQPADLSTHRYAPTRRLRRHLELRDKRCVFPGCPRLAHTCDKDHLIPWPRGSTSEPNLADECEPHHLARHHCFTVVRLPDGTIRWTSPTGHSYDRPPVPVLATWAFLRLPRTGSAEPT